MYSYPTCLNELINQKKDDEPAAWGTLWRESASAARALWRADGEKAAGAYPPMLPRKNRLVHRKDIRAVLRQGKTVASPFTRIYCLGAGQTGRGRAALVVGRKVSPKATTRHKYQRWLREIARDVINRQGASCDMVWVALPAIAKLKNQNDLRKKLRPYLSKLCSK